MDNDCDECSNQDSENAKTSLLSCLHKNHPSGVVFLFVPVVLALLSRRETASEKKKIAAAASSRRRDSPAG